MSDLGFIWRKIDTAPRDGTALLVFHPDWDMLQVGIFDVGTSRWQEPGGDLIDSPAFWTKLPPGPLRE